MTVVVHQGRELGFDSGETESGVPWINAAGETFDDNVRSSLDRVGRELAQWVQTTRGSARPSLFNRAAYVAPNNPYSQMATAKSAVQNDDIIGGVLDVTEGLIFQGTKWESSDATAADIFNQISRDLNLDQLVRQWYREDFTYSQSVMGIWWGAREYTPRLKTDTGKRSKRKVRVACPVGITFLDPTKVVPMPPGAFGQDRLAWSATQEEYAASIAAQGDPYGDPMMREFTLGPMVIDSKSERDYLEELGLDPKRLLALNPATVIRFCRTKSTYERFPDIRLKSTFPLLDLKQQLMEADRVNLVGAANFILLVRQGSKEEPATQAEIDNLKENFKVVAKLPVVVGDHRLSIDIITPSQEYVLEGSKYDALDQRLLGRTLGALTITQSRGDTTLTVSRGVARLLENRRHMLKRLLEEEVARRIVDHPGNEGIFEEEPNLTFTPRNVQIDSDSEVVRAILSLRSTNDLSRESTLEYFGFDQAVEALRREFEAEEYDDTFKTQVPFSSPNMGGNQQPPEVTGAQGGRPAGGGESPQSVQGQTKARTPTGNPSA